MSINLFSLESIIQQNQIEWDVLTKIICKFSHFDEVKNKIINTLFCNDLESLNFELIHTQHYIDQLKDEDKNFALSIISRLPSDNSISTLIQHINKNGILNFSELNKIAYLIEGSINLKSRFSGQHLVEFQNISKIDFNPITRGFLKEFRYLVDESGNISFDRHPELSALNKKLRDIEEKIRSLVQEWISDSQNQKVLQFSSYDIHFDRFVVPVRSDSYRSEFGIIVSRSETGQTLYVEPFQIRELCNKRLETIAKIDETINQLAMKFSNSLFNFSSDLKNTNQLIMQLDHYIAKSSFAIEFKLFKPFMRATPGFKFTNLFHPLIKNAVKNSADLVERNMGIVISGPNTGGKTVFLKSIALSYMLFLHGFFVPASHAEMFPYKGVFYFGNDLQDLKSGLSSFSGEVKNYIELIDSILPSNLILIDEIFNSTSSDEASALSLAYFNELHKRAICHIVVSTHHQMFKTLIHQNNDYLSCHVGFDTQKMRPTYKIQWGTPGSSMAIDIFRILSKDHSKVSSVPDSAIKFLNSKNISYETLLQKVSQKQIELDQLISSNRQLEIELKNQKGAMEGILNLKLNDELNKAKLEVDRILNEARRIVESARLSEISKTRKIDERSYELKSLIDTMKGTTPVIEEQKPTNYKMIDISLLKEGDSVFSHLIKKEFIVQKIDLKRNEVLIGKGPFKINVPANTLSYAQNNLKSNHVSVTFQKTKHSAFELDARGMRLSEFQNSVDSALGDLLSGDIPFLNIIHGHGDGILKNWLRDFIRKSKDFTTDTNESGNDGETRVILK